MENKKWIIELKERTGYKQIMHGTREEAIACYLHWVNLDYPKPVSEADILIRAAE